MKKLFTSILLLLSLGLLVQSQDITPVLANGKYSFTLGDVFFEVSPNTGGRISSLKYKDTEFMWVNQYTVANMWGSTFWPSPQSRWSWPPSTTLDQGTYTATIINNVLELKSSLDYSTGTSGLRVKKAFYMNAIDTSISIRYTLLNENATTNYWSCWEITRVPAGGLTFYPAGTGVATGTMSGKVQTQISTSWYDYNSSDAGDKKFIQDGSDGWLAHVNENNILFVKKFVDVPSNQQAPGEAEIEVYLNSGHNYIELENQGKYTNIAKGDSIVYELKWYLKALPTEITATVGNQGLVNYVKEIVNPTIQTIEQMPLKEAFNIYPNPSQENIIINSNSLINENKIIISNCIGQIIHSYDIEQHTTNNIQINVSKFQSGLYFIKIGSQTQKFIKQ